MSGAYKKSSDTFILKQNLSVLSKKLDLKHIIYESEVEYGNNLRHNPEINIFKYSISNEGKIYIADNSLTDYRIKVYDIDGVHIETIIKSYSPILRTKQEYEEQKQQLKNLSNLKNFNYDDVKYYPSIYSCFHDNKNRLWVFTPKNMNEKDISSFKVDVFNQGKFLNSLFLDLKFDANINLSPFVFKIINDKLIICDTSSATISIYKIVE